MEAKRMSDDKILLERIAELEAKLKQKNAPAFITKQIGEPFVKIFNWWWKDEVRAGLTFAGLFFGAIILGITWLSGGWITDNFYIEHTHNHGNPLAIYQKYDWGLDPQVGTCKKKSLSECFTMMKEHKKSWDEYQEHQEKEQ